MTDKKSHHAQLKSKIFRGCGFTRIEFSTFLLIFAWTLQQRSDKNEQKLDGTRRAAIHGYASVCSDLDLWPFDLISTSQTHITQFWWKYLRIYCIHPVFRVTACGDLDLWPLIPKANQHIYEPKYICDQNWVKFPLLGCEIWCMLWPWRLTF